MSDKAPRMVVSKLDAARRQLHTALRLWFHDGDPVSIHTLAFAAYEILHVISKKRNRTRDLLFDSLMVKDEYRSEWNKALKEHANFFKHANNDFDATVSFAPEFSQLFMLFAIMALQLCGETLRTEEQAFNMWIYTQKPEFLAPEARKLLEQGVSIDQLDEIRRMPKREFLENIVEAQRRLSRKSGF